MSFTILVLRIYKTHICRCRVRCQSPLNPLLCRAREADSLVSEEKKNDKKPCHKKYLHFRRVYLTVLLCTKHKDGSKWQPLPWPLLAAFIKQMLTERRYSSCEKRSQFANSISWFLYESAGRRSTAAVPHSSCDQKTKDALSNVLLLTVK